jgi:hypothetical protein
MSCISLVMYIRTVQKSIVSSHLLVYAHLQTPTTTRLNSCPTLRPKNSARQPAVRHCDRQRTPAATEDRSGIVQDKSAKLTTVCRSRPGAASVPSNELSETATDKARCPPACSRWRCSPPTNLLTLSQTQPLDLSGNTYDKASHADPLRCGLHPSKATNEKRSTFRSCFAQSLFAVRLYCRS